MKRRLDSLRGRSGWRGIVALLLAFAGPVHADPVLAWNRLMLDAIRLDNSPPTLASRNLTILHAAIYDAVNSIEGTHQPYRFQIAPSGPASSEAAAVGAGFAVLVMLYPQQRAVFDQAYADYANTHSSSPETVNGLAHGRWIGALMVDGRSADGASTQVTYVPSSVPGDWRRTPPFFRPPLDPHWGDVVPFGLLEIAPYLPPGPPPLSSAAYAADLNQVKLLGGRNSVVRTPEQSLIAVFWSDFSYTATPPGHWQEIAAAIARSRGNSLPENARLFARLSLAQADAAIVCWAAKYRANLWRPATAIQRADEDGNAATAADIAWESHLAAPPFPEYVSGHSTFSAASAAVLEDFYGTADLAFTIGSDSLPGVTRSFANVQACADEVGMSRIYGGIHFMSANLDGKESGARIGRFVSENLLLPNDRLPRLSIERRGTIPRLRIHGHIGRMCFLESSRDSLAWVPVASMRASVGGRVVEVPGWADSERRFFRLREE